MTFYNGTQGIIYFKASCRAATTADITLSGPQTIDTVSVVAGDRVLVKDQSTGANNGIYVAAAGAWARSSDAAQSGSVKSGLVVSVVEGSVNGNRQFTLTTDDPITLGTTALVFAGAAGMAIGGSITSATQGSVLFAGALGVLAQDNTNFFFDDTANQLKIANLYVSSDGTAALPSLTLGTTADPNTGYWHPAADTLALSTSGVERWRVTSTGLMGVNVTPTVAFHVVTSSATSPIVRFERLAADGGGVQLDLKNSDGQTAQIAKRLNAVSTADQVLSFTSNGTADDMVIRPNGDVGIGTGVTTMPAARLEVRKDTNGETAVLITNATGGTASRTMFYVAENLASGGNYGYLGHNGAGYTTSGLSVANRTILAGADTAGLLIVGAQADILFSRGDLTATTQERFRVGNAEVVSNEQAQDVDFRAEGSGTRPSLLHVDAGLARVGINRTAGTHGATLDIDNLAVAESIFIARDNGTAVFTIADGGAVSHALTMEMSTDSTYTPTTDNTGKVGTATNRFSEMHAVTVTTGDFEMKSPHDNGASGHWKLIEDVDQIVAINMLTGKRYAIAMTPLDDSGKERGL